MLEHDGWYELHCTQECVHYFPPTSPDLTPPDFFVWGYIKENCFKPPVPTTLEILKQSVLHIIATITYDICSAVIANMVSRLECCVEQNGKHIEHLM